MTKKYQIKPKKMSFALKHEEAESLYNKDFYKWTKNQSQHLRNGRLEELDLENLAEEIEALGISDKRALRSYLIHLIHHLLKLKYKSEQLGNSKSWHSSIRNARQEIHFLLDDSKSLNKLLPKLIEEAYPIAKAKATEETGMDEKKFPKECPWTKEELLSKE